MGVGVSLGCASMGLACKIVTASIGGCVLGYDLFFGFGCCLSGYCTCSKGTSTRISGYPHQQNQLQDPPSCQHKEQAYQDNDIYYGHNTAKQLQHYPTGYQSCIQVYQKVVYARKRIQRIMMAKVVNKLSISKQSEDYTVSYMITSSRCWRLLKEGHSELIATTVCVIRLNFCMLRLRINCRSIRPLIGTLSANSTNGTVSLSFCTTIAAIKLSYEAYSVPVKLKIIQIFMILGNCLAVAHSQEPSFGFGIHGNYGVSGIFEQSFSRASSSAIWANSPTTLKTKTQHQSTTPQPYPHSHSPASYSYYYPSYYYSYCSVFPILGYDCDAHCQQSKTSSIFSWPRFPNTEKEDTVLYAHHLCDHNDLYDELQFPQLIGTSPHQSHQLIKFECQARPECSQK